MDWNEETIVRLRGLWAEGHSTAEIGRRLGVTKNAVVGKAHRLDLPARPSPIRRDGVPGAQPRRLAPRRVAGPTLPPLSSSSHSPAGMASAVPVGSEIGRNPGLASVMAPRLDVNRPEVNRPEVNRSEVGRAEISRPERVRPVIASLDLERAAPSDVQPPRPVAEIPRPVSYAIAPPARVAAPPRPHARSLTCCWPIGEPGTKTFCFCDDGAVPGKPYCATHAAVAYVKVRDRREDAA